MMVNMFYFLGISSFVCTVSLVWSHPTSDLKTGELIDNFIKSLVVKHEKELSQLENELRKQEKELRDSNERQEQLEEVISQLQTQVTQLSDRENPVSSMYTRWGRKGCPASSGAELVYTGYAAGSRFDEKGGGSNYVCLTDTPNWKYTQAQFTAGKHSAVSNIYGAEYEFSVNWPFKGDNIHGGSIYQHDVPCAVCETPGRSTALMIPGTYKCPGGWQEEYQGYLSADYPSYNPTEFVCVDEHPEALHKGRADENGVLFYYTIAKCGSLQCPPYINDREVTCVVCSK